MSVFLGRWPRWRATLDDRAPAPGGTLGGGAAELGTMDEDMGSKCDEGTG